MKKLLSLTIVTIALMVSISADGQKLIIGERAPELKIERWLTERPKRENRAILIDFFYSEKQIAQHLQKVEAITKRHGANLDVIVVAYETPSSEIESKLKLSYSNYYLGVDEEGKSFANYRVEYIPFCVLIDAKGRVYWFGNPEMLNDKIISAIF